MKRNFLRYLLLTLSLASFTGNQVNGAEDELTLAKNQLKNQMGILNKLENTVERIELGRLRLIKKRTESVLQSIESNGIANAKTMNEYHHLIVAYRYSVSFFKEIETESNSKAIIALLDTTEEIRKARGFDDAPYTQITANVFSQIHTTILQLKDDRNLPTELNQALQALVPELGKVIAIAKEGDRPRTFEAGTALYEKLEALYPQFDKILHSNSAFDAVLDLQGLLEFYAEFAQVEK